MRMTLYELEQRIAERAFQRPADSYTVELLDAGIEKCAKKLIEEGGELGLAATSSNRENIVGEAADLVYHLLVLLKSCGIPLAEIEHQLGLRDAQMSAKRKANVRGT